MLRGWSGRGWGPAPPAASAAATGSSAMPMIVITEPVTTGGKKRISLREERRDEEREEARDDHRAVDDQQALGAAARREADGDHRRDGGERHALQQRQPDADLPEPDRLDDRGDAAGEQVGVDEVDELLGGQADRVGEQDRHDHGARRRTPARAGTRRSPASAPAGPRPPGARRPSWVPRSVDIRVLLDTRAGVVVGGARGVRPGRADRGTPVTLLGAYPLYGTFSPIGGRVGSRCRRVKGVTSSRYIR